MERTVKSAGQKPHQQIPHSEETHPGGKFKELHDLADINRTFKAHSKAPPAERRPIFPVIIQRLPDIHPRKSVCIQPHKEIHILKPPVLSFLPISAHSLQGFSPKKAGRRAERYPFRKVLRLRVLLRDAGAPDAIFIKYIHPCTDKVSLRVTHEKCKLLLKPLRITRIVPIHRSDILSSC